VGDAARAVGVAAAVDEEELPQFGDVDEDALGTLRDRGGSKAAAARDLPGQLGGFPVGEGDRCVPDAGEFVPPQVTHRPPSFRGAQQLFYRSASRPG
jgi:hypothetical protein